jgi:hypothetical protein
MKSKFAQMVLTLLAAVLLLVPVLPAQAEDPIVLGCPLSTAFLYGWDAERGIKLAVDEINAKGGVMVDGKKRPFAVEVIDTRDLEPGVPVSDALLAVEKLILDKKADFILGGPVRSEAALAAMPLLSKYKKVSIVTTGVLTPKYSAMVAALEKTDIMGVYGRLRFDPKSHQVIPSNDPKEGAVGTILQWQNQQRVVVYPPSIAKGEIELPPWMKP